ncbi:Sec20 domain protein [Drechmeria coniospora]|uniref:Sec20 domain protein n=1 Tax=Drechmeria coniospora TaxID=98403 RepID=A0A151GKT2_DRECN|nr:Sec20 domain protein [Drechmeria coniospora]KYK57710.1 Sec20 domain protein [Drechmeria coniospora]
MSLQGLQERLAALQETTAQLRALVDRLATLKFQPGSVPLGIEEENSPSGELSAEIGLLLRSGLEEQELLREEIKYAKPEGHDKARLTEGAERLGNELSSYRVAFRKARLASRKRLEDAQRQERELLIRSLSGSASDAASPLPGHDESPTPAVHRLRRHNQQQQQSNLSSEDQHTVSVSSNVTTALRRTHDLIAAELYRSEYAHQTLKESSDALKQLNESYLSLDSMLANSKDLLGTLLRSQKSDTWYLQTAMYMLMVTAAWLIFRRILYGPLWWLAWLPLRIMFGVGTRAGSAVMQGGSSGRVGEVDVGERPEVLVEGLPNEDLPTMQVAQATDSARGDGDPDSMTEQVGNGVDEANEASTPQPVDGESDSHEAPRNTKKRMWEEKETENTGEGDQVRDEL